MGRPSIFTEEIADNICAAIALGTNLNRLCESEDYPDQATVYRWMLKEPAFCEKYARARQARADVRSDRSDALREDLLAGRIDPNQARVAFDIERWQAGKENPKRYGDKVQQEVSGTGPAGAINLIINPVDTEKK